MPDGRTDEQLGAGTVIDLKIGGQQMNIDVKETMAGECANLTTDRKLESAVVAPTFIKPQKPDMYETIDRLQRASTWIEILERETNGTPAGIDKQSWMDAYDNLYRALLRCKAEEKSILMGIIQDM